MYLKEIIISGFKSFADRTRIALEPGVTCIVGPNGCGKSNIVDAIRWVLGEQSAKALRGGKMQDVIFEGTDKRKALPFCEVSLLFTDCEDQLGTAFHEVEIKRRAHRDGGSDYYLNGKTCRLKDIQHLFMDTGIGRVSYSFMVQGQIDQILSTNPAERRLIFEEAAGITKYKSQRAEALQKLATVEQNLSRIQDVVVEIDRQSNLLKNQACTAVRYEKLKTRLTHLDLAHYAYQFGNRKNTVTALEQKVAIAITDFKEKQSALNLFEKSLDEKRTARVALTLSVEKAQESVFSLKTERDDHLHKRELAHTRKEDIAQRLQSLNKEIQDLENEIEFLKSKTGEQQTHTQSQLNLVGEIDSQLKTQTQVFNTLHTQTLDTEKILAKKRSERDQLEGKIRHARQAVHQSESELQNTQAQTTHGQEALKVLENQIQHTEDTLKTVFEKEHHLNDKHLSLESTLQQAHQTLQAARQAFRQQQDNLQKSDRVLAEKKAQLQVLESLQEKLEGCSQAARDALKGILSNSPDISFGILASQIEVEPGYERATEAVFGILMDTLLPLKPFNKNTLLALLKDKNPGRLCIGIEPLTETEINKTLTEFEPLKNKIRCLQPEWTPWIHSLLEGIYYIEDENSFSNNWTQALLKGFKMGVTQTGHLWDSRGFWYVGGAQKGQGIIQRRTEIKALTQQLKNLENEHTHTLSAADQAKENLRNAEQNLQQAENELSQLKQALSPLLVERKALENQIHQTQQTLQKNRNILDNLSQRHTQATERLAQANHNLSEYEHLSTEIYQNIQDLEKKLNLQRQERDVTQEALSNVKIDLSAKKQHLESLQQGNQRLKHQEKQIIDRLNQRQTDRQSAQSLQEQLTADIQAVMITLENLDKKLVEESHLLEKHRETLKVIENEISTQEHTLSNHYQFVRKSEIESISLSKQFNEELAAQNLLIEKVKSDYELAIDQLSVLEYINTANATDQALTDPELSKAIADLYFEPYDPENIHWGMLTKEIKQLKQSIQALGPVNTLSISEYQQLKERSTFIHGQVQDLTQARDELLTAIQDINQTSQALFEDTFHKVRTHFKTTFNKLFGGGTADLELVTENDILESGIDIIACPPGTKLKSLTLLSGGQKTMTAVALLFSIYQVKPSPFCVLDELDAPLDDANIGRFTTILKEYTSFSQFLVITHNKRTISAANILYGVTMPERGVTQLVSLKFEN